MRVQCELLKGPTAARGYSRLQRFIYRLRRYLNGMKRATTGPMWDELLLFVLGALFAVFLQVFISRLAFTREKRREAWIRKLNSYENFYRALTQLIDLRVADVDVPQEQLWVALADARKAAYDGESYDPDAQQRTERMRQITLEFLIAEQRGETTAEKLAAWRRETREIRDQFYKEEGIR